MLWQVLHIYDTTFLLLPMAVTPPNTSDAAPAMLSHAHCNATCLAVCEWDFAVQQVERSSGSIKLTLYGAMSPDQHALAVEIRPSSGPAVVHSGEDILNGTGHLVFVNSSSDITVPANWWVRVVGAHPLQPPGSKRRCIDVEVMQGSLGLLFQARAVL